MTITRRVFISSTFLDLVEHRKAVEKVVRQLDAVDISMEHLGARDERPKDECIRLIKEEMDVFVGIYAHRYGHIPDGEAISITEAEYEAATDVGTRRLVYMVNPSTPWVPTYVDAGESAQKLEAFKKRLQSRHMCAFFSSADGLAASVAADLGRYFASVQQRQPPRKAIDPEREQRLIEDLRSSDRFKVRRSIDALSHSPSPWLLDTLRGFVLVDDEQLAEAALQALSNIRMPGAARAIADGLSSIHPRIRNWSAYFIGELALFGGAVEAAPCIGHLIDHLNAPGEFGGILDEVTHSIAKIGGTAALAALIKLLQSAGVPSFLKAKALHGPGRFWSEDAYRDFVALAKPIIDSWPRQMCLEVAEAGIFRYITDELQQAVKNRIVTTDTELTTG